MGTVTINQPAGLGDIIWIQPILQMLVDKGFDVIYPVIAHYLPMAKEYLPREGVNYVSLEAEYPFKELFGNPNIVQNNNQYYLPLTYSHLHFPSSSLMISKYLMTQTPLQDWRRCIPRIRNTEREKKLWSIVNPKNEEFILANKYFGTPPHTKERRLNITNCSAKIIHIDYRDQDLKEFHPFDWIGIIEKAKEIHFVQTAFSFLADMYAPQTSLLHLYDRIGKEDKPRYLKDFEYVQRHPNWIYNI